MKEILIIGAGGFIGANLRYLLSKWAIDQWGSSFPHGTMIINISGSLLIGFILAFGTEKLGLDPRWKLFFVTGFLGAYTTFSTYMYESVEMLMNGSKWLGVLNPLLSTGLGLVAALVGIFLGKHFQSIL